MHRDKYPEKVPFRLTRHLINGMEMSGIEGNFRFTCENVMQVLRDNKDSLMAVLEAFVHDPLFNWKLAASQVASAGETRSRSNSVALPVSPSPAAQGNNDDRGMPLYHGLSPGSPLSSDDYSSHEGRSPDDDSSVLGSRHSRSVMATAGTPVEDSSNPLNPNNRAMQVIERIQNKLTGQDFGGGEVLDHRTQVSRLIEEATSEVNLAMLFHGWCPFWVGGVFAFVVFFFFFVFHQTFFFI